MEKFHIVGGIPLKGEMTPSGNKNAALPILAATLMTDEPVILHNVPNIRDVNDMRKLVASLGVKFEDLGGGSWQITARSRPAGRPGPGPVPAHPRLHPAGRPHACPHRGLPPSAAGRGCDRPPPSGYT